MSGIQAVGLGLATVDILIRLEHMPSWDKTASVDNAALEGGGMAATAMVAAARLGIETGYIGITGNDALGEFKIKGLEKEHVDVSRICIQEGPDPHVVVVYVDSRSGERMFAPVKGWDNTSLELENEDMAYIKQADVLLIDGSFREAELTACKWMHESQGTVVFDAGSVPRNSSFEMGFLNNTDILIAGSGYAQSYTGINDIYKACAALRELGPDTVIQTEGAQGCYTVSQEEQFHTPAFNVDVIDTTGAGDVFHGAYIAGFLKGFSIQDNALFSSAVSALKCMSIGGRSGIPCWEAVLDFLQKQDITFPSSARKNV